MLKSPTPPFAYFNKSCCRFSLPPHPHVCHAIPLSCHGWLNLYLIRRPAHLPRGNPTLYSFPNVVSSHTPAPDDTRAGTEPNFLSCMLVQSQDNVNVQKYESFAAQTEPWQCGRYITAILAESYRWSCRYIKTLHLFCIWVLFIFYLWTKQTQTENILSN